MYAYVFLSCENRFQNSLFSDNDSLSMSVIVREAKQTTRELLLFGSRARWRLSVCTRARGRLASCTDEALRWSDATQRGARGSSSRRLVATCGARGEAAVHAHGDRRLASCFAPRSVALRVVPVATACRFAAATPRVLFPNDEARAGQRPRTVWESNPRLAARRTPVGKIVKSSQ